MSRRGFFRGRAIAVASVLVGLAALPAAASATSSPAVVGAVANQGNLSGAISVAVSGQVAYTTAYWPGQLTAIDISNPSSPTVLGSTPSTPSLENGSNVTIAGHFAFVVAKNRNASTTSNDDGSGNALTIVDISNPSAPAVVGSVHDTGRLFGGYGVAVSGNFAYVAYQGLLSTQPTVPDTSSGGFSVIDITNPAGPAIVANIDNPPGGQFQNAFKHATSVAVSGHFAYVNAFYDQRITVVDITNPASPQIVASLRDPTNLYAVSDLAIQGNFLYAANQNTGLTTNEFTVVNVANPAHPFVQATVNNSLLSGAYRIKARGDFAYVAAINASAVSAIDISDPTHPRFAGDVQDAGHLSSVAGLDLDTTGRYVIASSPKLAAENRPTYPPYPGSGGPPNTGTISVIDMVPNPIAVTLARASEPSNPTTQTSANFSFSTNDDVSAVQCSLDGAAPGPCTTHTSQSLSGLALGSHTFTVRATDSSGHAASASYTWTVKSAVKPVKPGSLAAPKVSGKAIAGALLRTGGGRWSGTPKPTLTYQWQRCTTRVTHCTTIARATKATYRLRGVDIGHRIRVLVKARNSAGSASAHSPATRTVANFASGALSGLTSGQPRLRLTASAAPGLTIHAIRIALPKGLTFAASGVVTVRNARGQKLAFTARLVHGALVVTLKHTAGTVHITVSGLTASSALRARIVARHVKAVSLRITATETHNVSVTARTTVKVS